MLPERAALARLLGTEIRSARAVGGGDHRAAFRVDTATGPVFLKCGHGDFSAEAAGLEALAAAEALRIPKVLSCGVAGELGYLALEWLDLRPASRACAWRLGAGLARQHRVRAERFGWLRDNTIGASMQANGWRDDWVSFFAEQRLGVQLGLARTNAASTRLIERGQRLCESLGGLFAGHEPEPSLLHGDLWGGNWAADSHDAPVIFDPAVYFGDREADVAMTRLFGGFGPEFYAAYEHAWPLAAGAPVRATLYNLYHVLNHYNLFGGAYQAQALRMIDALLAEL